MTIGNRLRVLRKEANFTQQELCDLISIKQATYSKYERDQRSINVHVLIAVCEIYNVSADFILGLTNNFTPCEIYKNNNIDEKQD